jgi:hypothetical protein
MKTCVLKATVVTLFAVAIVVAPAALRAAESTNAPASGHEGVSKHKNSEHTNVPFHGKLTAIDKDAMTITVGERTFEITSETKITKDNVPATLADGVVGEMVGGSYKKNADGKLSATMIHFGLAGGDKNAEGTPKKKKKSAEGSETSTNSAAK